MIPDFQSIFAPFLKAISDRNEHKIRDVVEALATAFKLTESDRNQLLPSGKQRVFDNRVHWSRAYLNKAGLIDTPSRGIVRITDEGLKVLAENPDYFNLKVLNRYPEFVEFHTVKRDPVESNHGTDSESVETPEELLEIAYHKIRKSLAQELLVKVMNLHPTSFERLVVDLLVKMGYGGSLRDAGKAIGKSGDEGIDGTIKEDKLGLDIIYIQAKRWQSGSVVGRPEIQKFVGALAGQGAKKGIFLTTASFSKEAIEYHPKNETKIVLIDGEELAQLMIDYDLGVSSINKYEVKKIDLDYFGEE